MSQSLTILLAVLRAIGTSGTLAIAGIIVTRRGFITDGGRRCLAELSMNLLMPLQLFTSMLEVKDQAAFIPLNELIKDCWILLLLPLLVVGSGMALGKLVAVVTRCPRNFSKACVGAVAFANSTGMSITLLQVLAPALLQEGIIKEDPLKFLPVYLLLYPMLQWTVGSRLFGLTASSVKVPEPKLPAPPMATVQHLPQLLEGSEAPAKEGAAGSDAHAAVACQVAVEVELRLHSLASADSNDSNELRRATTRGLARQVSDFARIASERFSQAASLPDLDLASDPDFYPPEMMNLEHVNLQRTSMRRSTFRSTMCHSNNVISNNVISVSSGQVPCRAPSVAAGDLEANEQEAAEPRSRCYSFLGTAAKVARNALVPPVIGSALGLIFALIDPVQGLFVQLPTHTGPPLLGFLFAGLTAIGKASVPLNMLVLGSNLSKGCDFKAVPLATNLGILFMKNLGQPAVMAAVIFLLSRVFTGTAVSVWLVAMIVSCTPTANNIMVMVELSGQNKAGVTTCIFTQYIAAPFVLTFVVTVFLLYRDVLVPPQ